MKRSLLLNIHLILSAIFIPFLLIVPLTGSLYLLGIKGDLVKNQVLQIERSVPRDMNEKAVFFKDLFKEQNIKFEFEYIRETPAEMIFRPTSRDFYTASVKDGVLTIYEAKPSLLYKLMELHKGHGPQKMKLLEAAFGIALVIVLLTGLWLAMTVAKYRKLTLISGAVGLALMMAFLI